MKCLSNIITLLVILVTIKHIKTVELFYLPNLKY